MSHLNKQIWAHPCYVNNELKQYLYFENIFISLSLDDNIKGIHTANWANDEENNGHNHRRI